MGKCASKHAKEQKNRPVRLRLQVDTLQQKYSASKPMAALQILQLRQTSLGSRVMLEKYFRRLQLAQGGGEVHLRAETPAARGLTEGRPWRFCGPNLPPCTSSR